jgi:hypothetical protein
MLSIVVVISLLILGGFAFYYLKPIPLLLFPNKLTIAQLGNGSYIIVKGLYPVVYEASYYTDGSTQHIDTALSFNTLEDAMERVEEIQESRVEKKLKKQKEQLAFKIVKKYNLKSED